MKILHTSDWHLGQSFFTKSRKNEHAAFLKWLLQQVEVHQIDAIIVAGDVFDTGTPPSYARELYHAFIGELQGMQCTLVVLGGNHDSVSVLNESKALLKYLNSHVIASTYGELSEQVITLNDRKGQPSAVLCAVPFIRPRDVLVSEAGQSGTDKRQALGGAIKQHYGALYNEALSLRASIEEKQGKEGSKNSAAIPIIATGHLTALGVSQSESVRDIYIGTLEGFDAKGFPPADYIALGHIHRPQKVAKTEHIRYSGSPIPLSFDELNTQKQVVLITFESESTTPTISTLPVPCFQAMEVIKGDLKAIEAAINKSDVITLASQTDDAVSEVDNAISSKDPVWLCIEVETEDYLTDLQQRIQGLLEGKNAEILQLKRKRKRTINSLTEKQNVQLSELSVNDVFEARLALESIEDNSTTESAQETLLDDDQSARETKEAGSEKSASRINRIRRLFNEAVEQVHTNDEDAEVSVEATLANTTENKGE
ncbi:exonuclease subunit SbcD [Alteromonas macleodii]|uniref:Nuclease SbcCD subunit D n=1 Tax=Alteromonas macleodii (strain English Channel 673) TaxID=1004788 RepID=A0AB32ZVE4_ALTME|nr:exonuclease subunit SbcD [Alteromonas macleodii]AFT73502.1 exonuclease subunit SbcD [Alteromonas macleodii str. 'English Channel 673']MBL3808997.1 exonuclease subunit SbcD [Alteromonas macleodii]MBL3882534.1 exonuclease subunit SbcD [Alteromonas macleodii]